MGRGRHPHPPADTGATQPRRQASLLPRRGPVRCQMDARLRHDPLPPGRGRRAPRRPFGVARAPTSRVIPLQTVHVPAGGQQVAVETADPGAVGLHPWVRFPFTIISEAARFLITYSTCHLEGHLLNGLEGGDGLPNSLAKLLQ